LRRIQRQPSHQRQPHPAHATSAPGRGTRPQPPAQRGRPAPASPPPGSALGSAAAAARSSTTCLASTHDISHQSSITRDIRADRAGATAQGAAVQGSRGRAGRSGALALDSTQTACCGSICESSAAATSSLVSLPSCTPPPSAPAALPSGPAAGASSAAAVRDGGAVSAPPSAVEEDATAHGGPRADGDAPARSRAPTMPSCRRPRKISAHVAVHRAPSTICTCLRHAA